MPKRALKFAIDDESRQPRPLTAAEKAAVKRAEADIKAGRLRNHDDVAKRLRRRAVEIAGRAPKSAQSR